jgi:hypothetical protein
VHDQLQRERDAERVRVCRCVRTGGDQRVCVCRKRSRAPGGDASVSATTPTTPHGKSGRVCDRVVMRAYGCVERVCDHACGRGQMEEAGASEGAGAAGQESLSSKLERQIQELESLRLQKIDCLRQENERLQMENERLRQENESLRKENERLQKLANNRLQRLASELHRKRSRPDS